MTQKTFFSKSNTIKLAGLLVLAVFISSVSIALAARQLMFNWMTGDYETLTMKNQTQGTVERGNSLNANAGDEIEFFVYYHCGWDDLDWPTQPARGTTVKISYPNSAQTQISTTARLWASNVPEVNESGIINVSSAQKLVFENTAKWHHDGVVDNISVTVANNYIEKNIGDIACDCVGCYNNAGFVEFKARLSNVQPPTVDIKANGSDGPITINCDTAANLTWTSANTTSCTASGSWSGSKATSGSQSTGNLNPGTYTFIIHCTGPGGVVDDIVTVNVSDCPSNPNLTISKLVRNITQGQSFYQDVVSANPSDLIGFKIEINSTGDTIANNVTVKDILPSLMNYQGNLKIDNLYHTGNILSSIGLGSLASGQSRVITFEARVASESNFSYGTTSLINTGQTWADSVSTRSDSATVNVYRTVPPPQSPGLTIDKSVRNLTDNTAFSGSTNAEPLDRIEFQIRVNSIGTVTAASVIVRDVLPNKLTYEGNLKVDGVSYSGDIIYGINLGNLDPGRSRTITFEAKVASESNFSTGTTVLSNTGYVRADGLSEISDTALLSIAAEPTDISLKISKKVKNLTEGHQYWHDTISAEPSDKIMFRLVVTSNGGGTASDVIVKDSLTQKISWYGNLKVDGISFAGDIENGIDIGDIGAGKSKTITFEVLLEDKDEFIYGTTDLVNTATAYNVDDSDTDTAKVRVVNKEVAGAITEVPTGILDSVVLSLGITFLITYCLLLGFFFYQKTFIKSGFNLGSQISQTKSRAGNWYYSLKFFNSPEKSQRELMKAIGEIQANEK